MAIRPITTTRVQRSIQVNMTSMVDIVFLLIIFFVLVSQFISAENITVELPKPERSLAAAMEFPDRVVLNCQFVGGGPGLEGVVRYQLGPIPISDIAELRARLHAVKNQRPDVQVILRADRRVSYRHMREAMRAIAGAGIANMNIAAEVED